MAKPNQSEEARDKQKQLFIEYFEEVPVVKYAAMYVEITEQTAHNWLREDTVFFSRVNQAKSRWAKKRALKTRAEFQLERLDKEIWSEEKKVVIGIDPVKQILEGFGLDVREAESDTQESPTDNS